MRVRINLFLNKAKSILYLILCQKKLAYRCAFFGFIFIIFGIFYMLPSAFAALTPIRSVEIKSEILEYDNKDTGAWKINKSAKWTDRAQAEVTFDVDTVLRNRKKYTDILFVLDISASMEGSKLERVQKDTTELLDSLLSNTENNAALITFTDNASVLSGFTNDKDSLNNYVNSITLGVNTNYYRAFQSVDAVLRNYESEEDRECIVLFLTDGWPNRDTPNEVGQYNYLKRQYPYAVINGIQYEMGDEIMPQITRVTDNQYNADMSTLRNVLFESSVVANKYEKFEITDYIDDRYFYVDSASDIKIDRGVISFDSKNHQVIWKIDDLSSGKKANMKIKIKLKEEFIGQGGVYPTNEKEEIHTKIGEDVEDISSELTPILADNYKVIYEGNAPDDCEVSNVPASKNHSVYDTVEVSHNIPVCDGYYFKKWEIVNKDVKRLNDDYFIMPEANVVLKAVWKKLKVHKSSEGELAAAQTIYEMMADNSVLDDRASEFVTEDTGINFTNSSSDTNGKGIYEFSDTKEEKYPIYYYRGAVDDNNIKFANVCWKIVRTTDTGGVKLIYNGVPDSNGWCNNTGNDSQLKGNYNSAYDSLADVGYMYGERHLLKTLNYPSGLTQDQRNRYGTDFLYGNDVTWNGSTYTLSDTYKATNGWNNETVRNTIGTKYHYTCFSKYGSCSSIGYLSAFNVSGAISYLSLSNGKKLEDAISESFQNTTDSEIKKTIDLWYQDNLLNYNEYLEDTIWCNDRSVYAGPLKGKDNKVGSSNWPQTLLGPYIDEEGFHPSLSCPENDSFTVSRKIGNGALTYPVATITETEIKLSGLGTSRYAFTNYLSGSNFWTMSPGGIGVGASVYDFSSLYLSSSKLTTYNLGIRPMISLKPGMRISSGDGSVYDPYVVQMS